MLESFPNSWEIALALVEIKGLGGRGLCISSAARHCRTWARSSKASACWLSRSVFVASATAEDASATASAWRPRSARILADNPWQRIWTDRSSPPAASWLISISWLASA